MSIDALNFERAQNHINAMRGDPVAAEALNRRILGNRGPTVDSVMQQTVDSYRAAEEIGNAGIAANLVLLGVPVPGASNSVTTNIGPSAPRSPLAGSIRNVNPSGGTQNCVDCAIATDATLAGRPTIAAASGPRRISVIEKEFGESFVPMTRSEITNHMTTAGSGARGIVFAEGSEQNHAFNVVNQNGTIRFLDGQTGRAVDWQRSWKNFMFLRTNAQ